MRTDLDSSRQEEQVEMTVGDQYQLVKYNEELDNVWDSLVSHANSGTFLHTRRFLSYHGKNFDDQSLLIYDQAGILRATFPAAVDPYESMTIISHPGITY